MKLAWVPLAVDDREAIFDYIEEDNPRAAADLDELFERKAALLVKQPKIVGRTGRVAGTRELVAHRHYVLVYEVQLIKPFYRVPRISVPTKAPTNPMP